MAKNKINNFRRVVWAHYKREGRRHLPWRKTRNAYKILVSEVMLQQTQVERVIPFYNKFTKQFPTARRLAAAPLGSVLRTWQGLGYNRRAKMLHEAAKEIVARHAGGMPREVAKLDKLPGVGPYTARAIAALAFNQDVVFVETNIRTAIIQHFFKNKKRVADKEIEKILARALPRGRAREWYSALMDYGAHLKQSGVTLNAQSKHYTKQARFAGSLREARGAILRALASGSRAQASLIKLLGSSRRSQLRTALAALVKEGLVTKLGRRVSL